MKIGIWLCKEIPARFRGKHRLVKKPTFKDLLKLRHDFEREEENMLFLRHPYLTVEQSYGHMKDLKPKKEFPPNPRDIKFEKRVTIIDHLKHLNTSNAWD